MYEYLGKGFSYPFSYTNGQVSTAEGLDSVRASIIAIISTKPGELFMSPQIGSKLWTLVFKPIDSVFYSLATRYVKDALEEQEPRIKDIDLNYRTYPSSNNLVDIIITYTVISSSTRDSVVYTFNTVDGGYSL